MKILKDFASKTENILKKTLSEKIEANELNLMNGKGILELTGQLGDVMKESAKAANSFIRSRIEQYNIDTEYYTKNDIHIHVPDGGTPKDGPSAGITLATAMVSALTGIPIRGNVAMTGEITIRGRVLPIGGLKEKVLAAHRAGINIIIVPMDNKKDLEEIPENVKKKIKFVFASDMEIVLETALSKPYKRPITNSIKAKNELIIPSNKSLIGDTAHQNSSIIEQ
jgi:ATP-dependent Lon protease